ncbi:MAG TPA: alpha/beta hydrolase [Bryobacteraceae bacterium]|nr:alpha/beta hydrolase [Bryobacteraceae bacterium]
MKTTLLLTFALATGLMAQAPFQVKVTGHGQPMILVPGLSSSGEVWETTVEHYKNQFECHVLTVAGFAGVPRVAAPMLDNVRDGIADYIRQKHLDRPVIVGHSLGGFLALALASKYPALVGRVVIVDAYPFLPAVMNPTATLASGQQIAAQMKKQMDGQTQADYERYVKSGAATRLMVTSDTDFARIVAWGLASDRTAVADAMAEMFSVDLRDDVAAIKSPTLVLGSWIAYKQYTDRARTEGNLRTQYTRLAGVRIEVTDTARHFIMWDDPKWMFGVMDRFLAEPESPAAR